ncbi:uncharacterized protein IWZ02DRAFT_443062 [Phyllosticta citriasiana]|uniref:uncharacterized protein n=1 Tax=Phyllosticta citriasiana TaxID=595635 RepID=UPI0030FDD25A
MKTTVHGTSFFPCHENRTLILSLLTMTLPSGCVATCHCLHNNCPLHCPKVSQTRWAESSRRPIATCAAAKVERGWFCDFDRSSVRSGYTPRATSDWRVATGGLWR